MYAPLTERIENFETGIGTLSTNSQEFADSYLYDDGPTLNGYETTETYQLGPPMTLEEFSITRMH